MHATTKPLSASSPAPPGKWASRLLTESETTLGRQELVNQFDAAQFEALGPWITGFEFGGNRYGGQYRADTDSRILRFISTFRERLAAWNRGPTANCADFTDWGAHAPRVLVSASSPKRTFDL